MKTQTLSFLAMAVLAVVGCSKEGDTPSSGMSDEIKLETYTGADWLHDIDEARAVIKRLHEKYGQTDFALIDKLTKHDKGPSWAFRIATDPDRPVRKCWPSGSYELVTTANTDHDCLDKLGYTRSR
jgi:hypothetical protein